MKRYLLVLLASLTLLSCSKDDKEKVEYSDTKGYLTNLTSVHKGLEGKWKLSTAHQYRTYSNGNRLCLNSITPVANPWCSEYAVLESNGRFTLRCYKLDSNNKPDYTTYDDYALTSLFKAYYEYKVDGALVRYNRFVE